MASIFFADIFKIWIIASFAGIGYKYVLFKCSSFTPDL